MIENLTLVDPFYKKAKPFKGFKINIPRSLPFFIEDPLEEKLQSSCHKCGKYFTSYPWVKNVCLCPECNKELENEYSTYSSIFPWVVEEQPKNQFDDIFSLM